MNIDIHYMLQVARPHSIGFVQFSDYLSKPALEALIAEKPLSLLIEDEDWDITANRYRKLMESHAFRNIEVLHITSLKIRWNQARNILREIQNITFPQLKELYLNGNNIESIEAMTTVSFKSLKVLNFKENNIDSVRSLRKCSFPNLEEIMLYKNKIMDFSPLFAMHCPKLKSIWTTPQCDSFDSSDSMSWVFRLQSSKIKHLFVKHERGQPFNFQSWRQMAKRAYPGAKLIYRVKDDIGIRLE